MKGIQGVEAMLQDTGAEGKDNTFGYFVTNKLADFLYFQVKIFDQVNHLLSIAGHCYFD